MDNTSVHLFVNWYQQLKHLSPYSLIQEFFTKWCSANLSFMKISSVAAKVYVRVLVNFYPYSGWPTWVKFSISLQTVPFGHSEFCKNECSESHTSLKAKNETLPTFFMFFFGPIW